MTLRLPRSMRPPAGKSYLVQALDGVAHRILPPELALIDIPPQDARPVILVQRVHLVLPVHHATHGLVRRLLAEQLHGVAVHRSGISRYWPGYLFPASLAHPLPPVGRGLGNPNDLIALVRHDSILSGLSK